MDRDGDDDLYVLNGYGSLEEVPAPQRNILYLNDGAGTFTSVAGHPLVRDVTFSGSGTWGDLDDDGDLDLFLTQWPINEEGGAPNQLYRNDGAGGNWIRIALQGTASNRSAIGALVSVVAEVRGETRRQTRKEVERTEGEPAEAIEPAGRRVGAFDVEVEGVSIVEADMQASNGILHRIDGAIEPEPAQETTDPQKQREEGDEPPR